MEKDQVYQTEDLVRNFQINLTRVSLLFADINGAFP